MVVGVAEVSLALHMNLAPAGVRVSRVTDLSVFAKCRDAKHVVVDSRPQASYDLDTGGDVGFKMLCL